ncbi:MAG: hypothetical protein KDA22_09310 [Phycisphaerales bacterium]|nr:hypothetical protein [Phycisphaerales bacterium]
MPLSHAFRRPSTALCTVVVLLASIGAGVASQAAPPTASPEQIKRWIEQLDSSDLATRHQAADAIVAVGEPALPLVEEAFASGRLKAMGQPKIVLMALRSMRDDRLWSERLAALASEGMHTEFLLKRNGRASGKATLSVERPDPKESIVEFRLELGVAGRPVEETITATLALDRTLSPIRLRSERPADAAASTLTIADNRAVGTVKGEAVDRPVGKPLSLDLAIGLVAAEMPLESDATLVTTVLASRDGTCSGTATLRCMGKENVRIGGESLQAWVFELTGEGFDRRRYVVSDDRRLLAAEVDRTLAFEAMRRPEGRGGREPHGGARRSN